MSIFRRERPDPVSIAGGASLAARPEPSSPTPDEELPDWVMSSVWRFLQPFLAGRGPASYGFGPGYGYTDAAPRSFAMEIERTCQIPVPWQHGPSGVAEWMWQAIHGDRALAVRVIDYALGEIMLGYEAQEIEPTVQELDRALRQAGANYVVVKPDPNWARYQLERRTIPAAAAAARAQTSLSGNASDHLAKAWRAAFGREPNPSVAYSEAVKAVEAAAIPVVVPNDSLATLGKVVGELRTNPQKYSVVFTRDSSPAKGATLSPLELVVALADSLWSNQTDRHGAGDPQPTAPVTQAQAELAVNIAVTLVHTFRSALT